MATATYIAMTTVAVATVTMTTVTMTTVTMTTVTMTTVAVATATDSSGRVSGSGSLGPMDAALFGATSLFNGAVIRKTPLMPGPERKEE
jgi:hypothetical protein